MKRVGSAETTLKIYDEFNDVLTGTGSFKGTFSLQVKDNVRPYQVLPRYVAYALQESFQIGLERLQEH